MAKFKLKPQARRRLKKIYKYTYEQWGQSQADQYVTDLNTAFQNLADRAPNSGRARDEIKPGYRSEFSGSHTIFFQNTKYGIEVLDILSQRMRPADHL